VESSNTTIESRHSREGDRKLSHDWFASRQVLISPISIKQVDRATNQLYVNLTMEQVENSPDIDTQKPVSRQRETAYFDLVFCPAF
jgi:hypothetical protein